ncbi:hypothetical protein ACIFOT_26365 [Neobacillus sp. NRS-1170]|uniref:hypothetical protein n=1 Tax=Neobacillus sp. NRS-1170 TaxID=3233898 RepID=UPI003D280AA7
MKYSDIKLGDLLGGRIPARRKRKVDIGINDSFDNPIIHRQIHGEKVYVPLNLGKLWNQLDY